MSSPVNPPPTYMQALVWDPPQNGRFTDIHHPRNSLAGHPLTPFLSTTQLPRPRQVLGTASDPLPIHRGLQAPLVLSAPQSTGTLGVADDLSTRMIDSLLLTGQYSTTPPHLARFWLHGIFMPDQSHPDPIASACSMARRWLLEGVNGLTDLPNRVKNIIGRELAHQTRWSAKPSRTPHPTATKCDDATPLPDELRSGFLEIGLAIPTSCIAIGLLYQLTSHQREFSSAGPVPPFTTFSPSVLNILRQQKIRFLRDATAPAVSGRRVKIRSPLFSGITGPELIALLQDLLICDLASALTSTSSALSTHPQYCLEDLPEQAQFVLQFADAIQPLDTPTPIEADPAAFWVNILHLPENPIHSQSGPVSIPILSYSPHELVPPDNHLHNITITPPPVSGLVPGLPWSDTCLTTVLIQSRHPLSLPCIKPNGTIPSSHWLHTLLYQTANEHLTHTNTTNFHPTPLPTFPTTYTSLRKFPDGSYFRSHPSNSSNITTSIQVSLNPDMYCIIISTNGTITIPLKHTYTHRGTLTNSTCTLTITPHHYSAFGKARLTDPIFTTSPSPHPLNITKRYTLHRNTPGLLSQWFQHLTDTQTPNHWHLDPETFHQQDTEDTPLDLSSLPDIQLSTTPALSPHNTRPTPQPTSSHPISNSSHRAHPSPNPTPPSRPQLPLHHTPLPITTEDSSDPMDSSTSPLHPPPTTNPPPSSAPTHTTLPP